MTTLARRVVARFYAGSVCRDKEATEFNTPEALKEYLRNHPGADPRKHSVKPQLDEKGALKHRVEHKPDRAVSKHIDELAGPAAGHPFLKKLKSQLEGDRSIPKHVVDRALGAIAEYIGYDDTSKGDKAKLNQLRKHLKEYAAK